MRVSEEHVNALRQAIAEQNTLLASLLVGRQFDPTVDTQHYIASVAALAEQVKPKVPKHTSVQNQFQCFMAMFHKDMAFSGDDQDFFNSKYSLLNQVIDYRTGIPVTLAIVITEVAKQLGFDAHGVNFPGHFLVSLNTGNGRTLYIDPLTGKQLCWQQLQALYASIVGDTEDDEMPVDALKPASTEDVIVRLLHNLKASFIREEQYQFALAAVDLLIGICPNDPYERRDRGFLLHQLECPQVAKADYQFFIKHCPQDPSAQLLKLQMRQWDSNLRFVLH